MATQPLPTQRFIRKTELGLNEYRKNFRQIDDEIIAAITSPEADRVTPLMSKIYLRLTTAPANYWEREGVLRFAAEVREGKQVKAWSVLCDLLGVASATANKALAWMHKKGIIGYFAGKNGVGVRIFLNRAVSSIGRRPPAGKKILAFSRASSADAPASLNEAAFKETYSDQEILEQDFASRAPTRGTDSPPPVRLVDRTAPKDAEVIGGVCVEDIIQRLRDELEPALRAAAAQAAKGELERTRAWLEERGLPKAARVAQREAYNVLRRYGAVRSPGERSRAELTVGRHERPPYIPRPLAPDEIHELAEICVAMLKSHGQAIEATLATVSSEAGGYLLPEDAPRVRDLACTMLAADEAGEGRLRPPSPS